MPLLAGLARGDAVAVVAPPEAVAAKLAGVPTDMGSAEVPPSA